MKKDKEAITLRVPSGKEDLQIYDDGLQVKLVDIMRTRGAKWKDTCGILYGLIENIFSGLKRT